MIIVTISTPYYFIYLYKTRIFINDKNVNNYVFKNWIGYCIEAPLPEEGPISFLKF